MTIRRFLTIAAMTTALASGATTAGAQGIPVYDNTQNINQLKEIANMIEQLDNMQDQLRRQTEMRDAMSGGRNMGDLLNGSIERDMRRYAPDQLEDLMMGKNMGGSQSGVQNAYTRLNNDFKPLTPAEYDPYGQNHPRSKAYERQVQSTFAALSASEGAYNNAAKRNENYETILEELNTTTDIKAAIDLQTRANIENGMVLNELTRLISLQMQQEAARTNQELADRRLTYDANQPAEERN